jgi:hypothetical protein
MIDWLDAHAGSLTVLVTFVLVVITAYYAKQTHDQPTIAASALEEARRLNANQATTAERTLSEAQKLNANQVAAEFRPMLAPVDMALQPAMFSESDAAAHPSQLVIENIGVGPALNVAAQVQPLAKHGNDPCQIGRAGAQLAVWAADESL